MDIKIICTEDNLYFKLGISGVLEDALLSGNTITFLSRFDSESLAQVDLIITNDLQWRLHMCQPAYRLRKRKSVILVFAEQSDSIISARLPICYQSLTVLSRQESVINIRKKITEAWLVAQNQRDASFRLTDCRKCHFTQLSLKQLQVIIFMKKGNSVHQTAKILGLSVKTIYAHKYNIMRKYGLKGDYEFYTFISSLYLLEL